jgi:predicted transcriptional regulator
MTRKIVTAHEDTPLAELAGLMVRRRINRVPIVADDPDGKTLVGIVTREDVLRGLLGLDRGSGDIAPKGDPSTR